MSIPTFFFLIYMHTHIGTLQNVLLRFPLVYSFRDTRDLFLQKMKYILVMKVDISSTHAKVSWNNILIICNFAFPGPYNTTTIQRS